MTIKESRILAALRPLMKEGMSYSEGQLRDSKLNKDQSKGANQ